MVPIYCPPVIVSRGVLAEEAAIIRDEGWYHVRGKYIASAPLADHARRVEAERRVAERERLERNKLPFCAFCYESIPDGVIPVTIATRSVHPHCAEAFDEWVSEKPAENDHRWLAVSDDTLLSFEGEVCRWGDLLLADRKVCEILPDGSLVGGYSI